MDINNMTIGEFKKLQNLFNNNSNNDKPSYEHLKGKQVTFFCLNYIYHGEVISVSSNGFLLKNAKKVFETGAFDEKGFEDAQPLNSDEFEVTYNCIESLGILPLKND